MPGHESALVKKLHQKRQKLLDENHRLEEETFRAASLPDKIHAYLTMLALLVIILSPLYVIVQLIRIYLK